VTCEDKLEKRRAIVLKKLAEQEELEKLEKRRLQSAEKGVLLEKLDTSKWAFSAIGSEEGTSEAPLPAPDSPDPEEGTSVADADSTPADSKPSSERNSPDPSSSTTPVSEQDDDSKNAEVGAFKLYCSYRVIIVYILRAIQMTCLG